MDAPVRRNVLAGLLLLAVGLAPAAFLSSARDFPAVARWFQWAPVRSREIMYAHAHLGVLGLLNIALGFVLPGCILSSRVRTACSWGAVAAGILVPAGMFLSLLPDPWGGRLVRLQMAGFLSLLSSILVTAWGSIRSPRRP